MQTSGFLFLVPSLVLFLLFLCFVQFQFVSFVLSYHFILLFSFRSLFCFLRRDRNGFGWELRDGGTGRVRGMGNHNQKILCEGKDYFQ